MANHADAPTKDSTAQKYSAEKMNRVFLTGDRGFYRGSNSVPVVSPLSHDTDIIKIMHISTFLYIYAH